MGVGEEIARIASLAAELADVDEVLSGVVASEPREGWRLYVCSYERAGGELSWLVLDRAGLPLEDREALREAVSIAALCELAEETAAGGDADELRERLEEVGREDASLELEPAQAAAQALAVVTEAPPRVASPAYLDRVAAAARQLELALGGAASSGAFASTLQQGMPAIEALIADVERGYKRPLT